MTEHHDIIVIGAGMGGLVTAVALARAGRSVLVLEKHRRPGGLAQTFPFDGGSFSPGLHYLGGAHADGTTRRIFEGLGVAERLELHELDPDGYDRVVAGDLRFDVPAGGAAYADRLRDAFPGERPGIERYLEISSSVARAVAGMGTRFDLRTVAYHTARSPALLRWGMRPLASVLDHTTRDPVLRAVLSARCGHHGLAPSRVSFPVHASMDAHYLDGGFAPRGGGGAIAAAMVAELEARGGALRLEAPVRRILLSDGAAIGVELESRERLSAREVVSDLHPAVTFGELLRPGVTREGRRRVARMETSTGVLGVHCTLHVHPSRLGLGLRNVWWYRHPDVEAIYARMARGLPAGRVDGLFMSPGVDDGSRRGAHTLSLFTLVPYAAFAPWVGLPEGRRGPDYERLVEFLGDQVVASAEHVAPGLREAIRRRTVQTPLTFEATYGAHRGGIYGTAKTPLQVGPFAFPVRSSVPHLFSVGASTVSHGVVGAALSGLAAARTIVGAERDEDLLADPDGSLTVKRAADRRDAQRDVYLH